MLSRRPFFASIFAAAAVLLLSVGTGCSPLRALRAGRELGHQNSRVGRIGGAVNNQSCFVTQKLLQRSDIKKIKAFEKGKLSSKKAPGCIGSARRGQKVNLRIRRKDGAVYCPTHGSAKDGRKPLEEVKRDINQRPEVPSTDDISYDDIVLILFGGGLFSALTAAYFAMQGGDQADLLAALRETALIQTTEVGGGYSCVTGKVHCEEPILAPRLREPVVCYLYRQVEEWEEQQRNRNGSHSTWYKRERILKEEDERVAFQIKDESGEVTVRPGGARLEARKLFEAPVGAGEAAGTGMGKSGATMGGKYRNHRFVHQVFGIAVEDTALVLGPSLVDTDGTRSFQGDKREERPYLLASATRKDMLERSGDAATANSLLMWAFGILSLLMFAGGLLMPSGL